MELSQYGLVELELCELTGIEGGGFWDWVGGWFVGKCLDYIVDNRDALEQQYHDVINSPDYMTPIA